MPEDNLERLEKEEDEAENEYDELDESVEDECQQVEAEKRKNCDAQKADKF